MLAAETVDTIIDYLHDDKATLAICSVICQSWLPAARFHLFSEVIVESDTVLSLLSVLETSPDIGLLVRSLIVQGRDDQEIALASQLSNLTTHLPRVHSLQISSVGWGLLILEDILQVLSRSLSTISRLALMHVKFHNFCQAATFICAFPTLRRLSMADVFWVANSPAAPMLTRPLVVEVSSMQIDMHARCLVNWLILQDPLPDIRTFFVQVGFDEGNDDTRRLLQSQLSPGIETLHLSLRKFTLNQPVQNHTFGLDRCTNLQVLHFHEVPLLFLLRHPSLVAEILSQLISPHLREVKFSMRLYGVRLRVNKRDELHGFDWMGVADMLTGPQFGALRTIQMVLIFDGESAYPDWEELVRARWSDFAKRGILVVKKQHV